MIQFWKDFDELKMATRELSDEKKVKQRQENVRTTGGIELPWFCCCDMAGRPSSILLSLNRSARKELTNQQIRI